MELSLVLAILAILVLSVVAGREVILTSSRNKVITDLKKYQEAYLTFKEKYLSPPGDMPDASSVWSAALDGDGDGTIDYNDSEMYRAWQHLSLEGLVEGYYAGTNTGAGSLLVTIGVDIPKGPSGNSGYTVYSYDHSSDDFVPTDAFLIGAANSNHDVNGGLFTADEASYIDIKIDNDNPVGGRLWAWGTSGATDCVNYTADSNYLNDTYDLDNETKGCYLINFTSEVHRD